MKVNMKPRSELLWRLRDAEHRCFKPGCKHVCPTPTELTSKNSIIWIKGSKDQTQSESVPLFPSGHGMSSTTAPTWRWPAVRRKRRLSGSLSARSPGRCSSLGTSTTCAPTAPPSRRGRRPQVSHPVRIRSTRSLWGGGLHIWMLSTFSWSNFLCCCCFCFGWR